MSNEADFETAFVQLSYAYKLLEESRHLIAASAKRNRNWSITVNHIDESIRRVVRARERLADYENDLGRCGVL